MSLREGIEKDLKERVEDTILSSYKDDFWISLSTLKPTPPVPSGFIQLCRAVNGSIRNTRKLTIPELLEKEGIMLKIMLRIYVSREIAKDADKKQLAEELAKEVIIEYITPKGLFSGITM